MAQVAFDRVSKLARIPDAVHAYQPHEDASRAAIAGAGMATATECLLRPGPIGTGPWSEPRLRGV